MSFIRSSKGTVTIDLSALAANFTVLDSIMGRGQEGLMPVIKSDAYGHCMEWVARELKDRAIWGFGIYEGSEGRFLRQMGIKKRIFLLSGLLADSPETAIEAGLTVGVVKREELSALDNAAGNAGVAVTVHLKVDTGMGRFGMEPAEVIELCRTRSRWRNLVFEGLYTHMPVADVPDDTFNSRQILEFKAVLAAMRDAGWQPEFVHMANSAALVNFPSARFNLSRPGIALYGACCRDLPGVADRLRPVMGFVSRLAQVRRFRPGSGFSYGRNFTCSRESLIAVVPVGYDNGYPRALSGRAEVLVNGKRCPVVGNICMRALLVDVTDVPGVAAGHKAVFLGSSGQEVIYVEELAEKAGTISYELLCLLGKLNRRIIVK